MKFELNQAIEILNRTPSVLRVLLSGLSSEWVMGNEGPDTWSAIDVLGHLVHGEETDWLPRAEIIQKFGEDQPFFPFDRFAQFEKFNGWSVEDLLNRFEIFRQANLIKLVEMNLEEADLSQTGMHPELGRVNLRQLLASWVVHDLNHLAQIAKVVAKQYTNKTGAWQAYLDILHQ